MIALLGFGKTTKALAKKFGNVVIFENIPEPYHDEEGFLHQPFHSFDPDAFTIVVPSPGIPPSHPAIQKAKNKIVSEYDLFASQMPYSIWVSGTNGKTTTTQMITHLLSEKKAVAGGNIGTPLAELDQHARIWVLETSSFTLHYTKIAKPNLYVLLPITPDHISWHESFEAYEKAKLKPLSKLKEGEVALVPKQYEHVSSNGYLIGYEGIDDLCDRFNIDPYKINFHGAFLLDALLALAVKKIVFHMIDYEAINHFSLDPHKQEVFRDTKGRVWIDDSKATNIDATLAAVSQHKDKKIHLILGGDNKGVDLEPLIKKLPNVEIYAIGKAEPHITELAKKYRIPAHSAKTLEKAVNMIKKSMKEGEIALLSPACASLDQFKNYKERGETFKQLVLS
ncbi:Mur ligase family protein [Nitratiruptor sp. SB155-2]|uniref:Mur ligase family protein n=1 Tax=Nitratiruptor sp. (strain SB155-2) TaxID=387092 RepID=UPI0001586DFD|nr:Mur ligase family protein [Nitratiruptor sp. SB155-2]BAF69425.1 UDP-N-acetylmuramoylalanine--D-glutamate ligase [Nitratiruptor sp. SB155-2]